MSFKSVENKIAAKQHIPKERAAAILAAATRRASAKAKMKNTKLKRVV